MNGEPSEPSRAVMASCDRYSVTDLRERNKYQLRSAVSPARNVLRGPAFTVASHDERSVEMRANRKLDMFAMAKCAVNYIGVPAAGSGGLFNRIAVSR